MTLRRNILNLFVSQSISYIIPLFQFPYLTRVLGVEVFGLYVFSYSIISFLMIITNYGFEIYLPKEMAERGGEKNLESEYFTQSTIIRACLLLPSFLILLFIHWLTDYYSGKEHLLVLITLSVLFNAFSLTWFFQGKEIIYYYSRITISIKLISMLLLFAFVNHADDIDRALFILAVSNFLVLITSLYLAHAKYKITFCKVRINNIFKLGKESFEYFISRLAVTVYTVMGGLIIGILSGSLIQVALYGVAYQLYNAGVYAMSALSTPLIPYMARTKNYVTFFKITALAIFFSICGACVGWFWGDHIIQFVYGKDLKEAKHVLDIFMLTIIFSITGIHFGFPALIPLGKTKSANLSVIYAGIGQLFMIFFIVSSNTLPTAAIMACTYLVCDFIMVSYRLLTFLKYWNKKCIS